MRHRGGQVGVVHAVLRALVAADVALAAQPARQPGLPVQVAVEGQRDHLLRGGVHPRHGGERHRERRHDDLQAQRRGRVAQRPALGQVGVGVRGRLQHGLHRVGVRVEVASAQRPVLVPAARQRRVVDEPPLVLAQQHVRVDQRPATQSAGDDGLQLPEGADVEQAVQVVLGLPERPLHLVRAAGEAAGRVRLTSLEQDDRTARLGQPEGRHRAPEARADHDGVHMFHFTHVRAHGVTLPLVAVDTPSSSTRCGENPTTPGGLSLEQRDGAER